MSAQSHAVNAVHHLVGTFETAVIFYILRNRQPFRTYNLRSGGFLQFRIAEAVISKLRLERIFSAGKNKFVGTFRAAQIRGVHLTVFVRRFAVFRHDFPAAFPLCGYSYNAREIAAEIVPHGIFVAENHLRRNTFSYAHRLARIHLKRNVEIGYYGVTYNFFCLSAAPRVNRFAVEKIGGNYVGTRDFPAFVRNDCIGMPVVVRQRKLGKQSFFVAEHVRFVPVAELARIPSVCNGYSQRVFAAGDDPFRNIVTAQIDMPEVIAPPRHKTVGNFVPVDIHVENSRSRNFQTAVFQAFFRIERLHEHGQSVVFS